MDDFPGNSRSRELPQKSDPARPKISKKPEQAEKVIVGQAKVRKVPLYRKFTQTFVQGSLTEATSNAFWNIAIPALKDLASDAGNNLIDGILYGESGRGRRYRSDSRNYTPYSRYSSSSREPDKREPRVRKETPQDFGELVLQSRAEAEMILDRMSEYMEEYGFVTVADMYGFAGESSEYTDRSWGWSSLSEARLDRLRGGEYTINLPRPIPTK